MALLESGPALWQQENDAPPSTKLRGSKAATGSENNMATPYMAKQTGKQPSQTARKALSNISNINHLHKQPLQPGKSHQPLATSNKSRLTIANETAEADAAPAQDNKMDALAAQLAMSDGVEKPAGMGWEQQHAVLQHTAMYDAAARARTMAALANSTATLSLADTPALPALEPEACPPSPPASAPFTDAEMVDILFPQTQPDAALLYDLLPADTGSSPARGPGGSPAFSVEEDCDVCLEGDASPPQPPSPPASLSH